MFTEYSLWLLIPIIIISFLGSMLLYFYPKRASYNNKQLITLFSLRFIGLFLVLSLIIAPVIKHKENIIQKPIIAILQDNSSSLLLTKDSNFYKDNYLKNLEHVRDELSENYDVKIISFGSQSKEILSNKIKSDILYNDFATDISECLLKVNDKYSNSNLSSIILCSDGIINKGNNPLNTIKDLQVPIYTIAMGDTTIRKDLAISETRYNRIAYLNNKFPLEIIALAQKANANSSIIRVKKDGKTLFEDKFNIDNDNFSKSFTSILSADKVGIQRYTISLEILKNEQTIENNSRDIFIEVLDSRQKVLILAASAHPDISAIKQSIESNENYEVDSYLYNQSPKEIKDYNIVILHQLPSNNPEHVKVINRIKESGIPILYIIGSQTNLSYFNSLSTGINISNTRVSSNEVSASFNPNFTYFSLSKETENILPMFPPLISPFGKITSSPITQSLANQKIGSINTNYPLIAYSNNTNQRVGVIFGEGFWRWRLQNYLINQTHNQTNEIIHKSIQYLASKVDKSRFRVICNNVFAENQSIIMDAELYNDSYELVNEPEVNLTITNKSGKKYPFTFSKTSNAYHLICGILPSGKYTYTAKTNYGGKVFSASGIFHVSTQNTEAISLVADHNLLFNISNLTSAKMLYPRDVEKIIDLLKERTDIKPIIHQNIIHHKLIDLWWYLLIIVLIFSIEWFLRKYWGNL